MSEVYTEPALVPASPWLGSGVPVAPRIAMRDDAASGYWVLDIAPGDTVVNAARAGATSLFVVQMRTDAGWTTRIVPATERLHVLAPRSGAAPLDVRVMAVDRVGNAGSAARLPLR